MRKRETAYFHAASVADGRMSDILGAEQAPRPGQATQDQSHVYPSTMLLNLHSGRASFLVRRMFSGSMENPAVIRYLLRYSLAGVSLPPQNRQTWPRRAPTGGAIFSRSPKLS
jgi:hypothetical protein